MADLRINRLALDLAGWSETQGSPLVKMIADRLAARLVDEAVSTRLENVKLDIKTRPNVTLDDLADEIVDGLLQQVRARA